MKTTPFIEIQITVPCSKAKKTMPNLLELKTMNRLCKITMLTAVVSLIGTGCASASDDVYADFPITLKGYDGTSKTSVSYGGQMARHLLHNGL